MDQIRTVASLGLEGKFLEKYEQNACKLYRFAIKISDNIQCVQLTMQIVIGANLARKISETLVIY